MAADLTTAAADVAVEVVAAADVEAVAEVAAAAVAS
jgi:hypothetical protein